MLLWRLEADFFVGDGPKEIKERRLKRLSSRTNAPAGDAFNTGPSKYSSLGVDTILSDENLDKNQDRLSALQGMVIFNAGFLSPWIKVYAIRLVRQRHA